MPVALTQDEICRLFDKPKDLKDLLERLSQHEKDQILNSQESEHLPPLHLAAFTGNVEATKQLLKAGGDPNFCCSKPELSPLMCACDQGSKDRECLTHSQVARLLIEAGAKVDVHGVDGFTPLLFAVDDGSLEIVELLLQSGADVNLANNNGKAYVQNEKLTTFPYAKWTALHHAAAKGHLQIAQTLLEKGANPNQKCAQHQVPLVYAFRNGNSQLVELLQDVTEKADEIIENEIVTLVKQDQVKLLQLYWKDNFTDFTVIRILYHAMYQNSTNSLQFLIEKCTKERVQKILQAHSETCALKSQVPLWNPYAIYFRELAEVLDDALTRDHLQVLELLEVNGLVECGWIEKERERRTHMKTLLEASKRLERSRPIQKLACDGVGHHYSDKETDHPCYGYQMVKTPKLGEIYRFLDQHKGKSKLFLYFEDTGASGLGGYRVKYFTVYLDDQVILEIEYIHEDRSYGVSAHRIKKFCPTVKELKSLIKEEIELQLHWTGEEYTEELTPYIIMKIDRLEGAPITDFTAVEESPSSDSGA